MQNKERLDFINKESLGMTDISIHHLNYRKISECFYLLLPLTPLKEYKLKYDFV
jgi:hypothetical protein